MPPKKRNGETAVDKALGYIMERVRSGEWAVGGKIPSEPQLTEAIGVSRYSVRSALQQLVGIGALESRHGQGTFLLTDDLTGLGTLSSSIGVRKQTLRSFLEFRLVVETGIAELAAVRVTDAQLASLEDLFRAMCASTGRREEFVRADTQFHEMVARASGNDFAYVFILDLYRKRQDIFTEFNDEFGYEDGIYYHALILDALRKHDAKAARSAMHGHLSHALERLSDKPDGEAPAETDRAAAES